jgi:hypothetical protein
LRSLSLARPSLPHAPQPGWDPTPPLAQAAWNLPCVPAAAPLPPESQAASPCGTAPHTLAVNTPPPSLAPPAHCQARTASSQFPATRCSPAQHRAPHARPAILAIGKLRELRHGPQESAHMRSAPSVHLLPSRRSCPRGPRTRLGFPPSPLSIRPQGAHHAVRVPPSDCIRSPLQCTGPDATVHTVVQQHRATSRQRKRRQSCLPGGSGRQRSPTPTGTSLQGSLVCGSCES